MIQKEYVRGALFTGKTQVVFRKANGEERTMICTLNEDLIPKPEVKLEEETKPKKVKKENPDVQAVWDLEKESWRSFRFDSVISLQRMS